MPGADVSKEHILTHMQGRAAKWWLPGDVAFVDKIPHTATGKISKVTLRERFKNHKFPAAHGVVVVVMQCARCENARPESDLSIDCRGGIC
jgi:hypothetical protein